MATNTRSVTTALLTLLRTINGVGSYTYDLTGSDKVVIAQQAEAWQLPQVLVHLENVNIGPGYELTSEKVTARYRLLGFVGADDDTGEARLLAALDLMQDLLIALRSDRQFAGATIDSNRNGGAFIAADETGVLYGVADVTIEIEWQESAV